MVVYEHPFGLIQLVTVCEHFFKKIW